MKTAKKRWHKKEPKFWQILKQPQPPKSKNLGLLGGWKITWPAAECYDDYEIDELSEQIAKEIDKEILDALNKEAESKTVWPYTYQEPKPKILADLKTAETATSSFPMG